MGEPPSCGFLSLPPEIRLQIYTYLLCLPPLSLYQKRSLSLHQGRDDHILQRLDSQQQQQQQQQQHEYYARPPRIHAALLLVNRQIHAEATPLLYTTNTFLAHPSLLASFPRLRADYPPVAASAAVSRIRRLHLRVRLDCDPPWDAAAVAEAFTGLDELSVHVAQAAFLGSGPEVLRSFEAVRGVARAVIEGSVTGFEDYVEWLCGVMRMPEGVEVKEFTPSEQSLAMYRLTDSVKVTPCW